MFTISWSTQTISESEGTLVSSEAEHVLQFDAVVKEEHEMAAIMSDHPVEGSANFSDHKRAENDLLSFEVIVTNTPIGDVPPSGYGRSRPPEARVSQNDAGGVVTTYSEEFDRVGDVFLTLRRLAKEPTLVTIETDVFTYDQMTILSVSAPREVQDGDSISFNVDAREVRVASTSLVDSPEPREPRGRPQSDQGAQEAQDAEGNGRANQSTIDEMIERHDNGETAGEAFMNATGLSGLIGGL